MSEQTTQEVAEPVESSTMFTFGDPEPVLANNMSDYTGVFLDLNDNYYTPPISMKGLSRIMDANSHHNSILRFKKNMVLKWFEPTQYCSIETLESAALDFVVTGNMYYQRFTNRFKHLLRVGHLPAIPMRRGKKHGTFFKVKNDGNDIEFKKDEVAHISEPDIKQSIYGVPEYMGGIQSVLLSEEATLFRRKYYLNGAHMGYILVTNDAKLDQKTAKAIQEQVQKSKGPGNFRSLYLNIPRSTSKDPVKVIPVGDIGTKDEFERIKNITRGEILSMHRMQPGLSGIMPDNVGGFGDIEKIMRVYYELEVLPLQQSFLQLNEQLGVAAIKFKEPSWLDVDA